MLILDLFMRHSFNAFRRPLIGRCSITSSCHPSDHLQYIVVRIDHTNSNVRVLGAKHSKDLVSKGLADTVNIGKVQYHFFESIDPS